MLNHAKRALLAAAVLGLAGCADVVRTGDAANARVAIPAQSKARLVMNVSGAPQATASRDWEAFRAEWRSAFKAEADAAGTAFVWQDGPPKPLGEAGTLLVVHVADYRSQGTPHVNAQMRYLSLADGRPFGEKTVNVSATDKPVQAIARDAMRELRR